MVSFVFADPNDHNNHGGTADGFWCVSLDLSNDWRFTGKRRKLIFQLCQNIEEVSIDFVGRSREANRMLRENDVIKSKYFPSIMMESSKNTCM